jgi:tetratricopeptide (TPR) repeat protein
LAARENRRQKGHSVIPVLRMILLAGLVTVADSCLAQVKAAPDSHRQEALTLEQQGKTAEAEAAWRAVARAQPSNPEPLAHLGLLEARLQHYKEAISFYHKALALDPAVPAVHRNLGLAYFKSGDMRNSIREFNIVLKSQPGDFQLTTLIGMAHYGLAEYKEAIPYLKDAAAVDKKSLPLRLALAHSCLWSKEFDCVMDAYHQILDLNAESAEADMLAGEALDEMKDNAGSTKMFRAAAQANPKEPNVHFGLGYLLWSQKHYVEAASEFKAELANDPDHLQSMLYLADTEIQMNQMEVARPLLEKVEKISGNIPLDHLDLGIIYFEAAENEAALRELSAASKLMPDDVNVHWRLARLYQRMGRKEESRVEFDKAGKLTKAADDANFKKIADANAKPAQKPADAAPPSSPPDPVPPN